MKAAFNGVKLRESVKKNAHLLTQAYKPQNVTAKKQNEVDRHHIQLYSMTSNTKKSVTSRMVGIKTECSTGILKSNRSESSTESFGSGYNRLSRLSLSESSFRLSKLGISSK